MNTSVLSMIVWFVLLLVFFYFILIRPQQKAISAHKKFVSELRAGAKVVTRGGIYGTIKEVFDSHVMLRISKDVEIRIDKNSIERLQTPES